MNKYIGLLIVFALSSVVVSTECKPGYQSAKVVKVLHVSPGVAARSQGRRGFPATSCRRQARGW